jgi:DNA repair protein RecN (Recombination protein N)
MLSYLHVKNIALIENLEISFDEGLNILTGETGAGKSIILGSINHVLGAKFKKDFIRRGAEEAFVECVFDLGKNAFDTSSIKEILAEYGIPIDESLFISRKTSVNGRSVFRVNGEIVRQDVVTSLASYLIDIHSQHEHQSLISGKRQLELLDRFSGSCMSELLVEFESAFREYNILRKSINEDLLDDEKRKREIAFLEFEMKEIELAQLVADEDNQLQERYDTLSHQQVIIDRFSKVNQELYGEVDVAYLVSSSLGEMQKCLKYDSSLSNIVENLTSMEDLMLSVKRDMTKYLDQVQDFEEELYACEKRLDTINQLKLKYGDSIAEILDYAQEKAKEHEDLVHFEERLRETKENIHTQEVLLKELGQKMRKHRVSNASILSESITHSLVDLNLQNAQLQVLVEPMTAMTVKGFDKVVFMITTNKGEPLKPLSEVASGGELSRVMLAIKSVLASVDGVDTLIFDEIDTGISGQTAQKVAEKMRQLSKERQLVCITHLPQIAAMANHHYLITKETKEETTLTDMVKLSEEESIDELARMLSGAVKSDIVIANAREMKQLAKNQ